MTASDSLFYYGSKAVEWLNPAVYFVGLGIAAWAFLRCRKCGYLVLAIYFALAAFELLAMPSIDRAIRAHRPPDVSEQIQQKIDAAVREATHKVLAEEGHPEGISGKRLVNFPFGQILLVAGLWLVARRETRRPDAAPMPSVNGPE
jgi:hypothetical protein